MSGTYQVVMGDRGRLVIPADLRERAGLAEGTALILLETPAGLVLLTRPQLRERVRADLAGLDLVGELLAERRGEAAADDAAWTSSLRLRCSRSCRASRARIKSKRRSEAGVPAALLTGRRWRRKSARMAVTGTCPDRCSSATGSRSRR